MKVIVLKLAPREKEADDLTPAATSVAPQIGSTGKKTILTPPLFPFFNHLLPQSIKKQKFKNLFVGSQFG